MLLKVTQKRLWKERKKFVNGRKENNNESASYVVSTSSP